jgi:PPOX class probable F420-dependent enzyme
MNLPSAELIPRLETEKVIWVATTRPDGRPHLAPVWFVWHNSLFYISTEIKSVKARNIQRNPAVALALENGEHPLICEGEAFLIDQPYPEDMLRAFHAKYEWDINTDDQYNQVIAIRPQKWLAW